MPGKPSCVAFGCSNIGTYNFPKDLARRKLWILKVNRQNFEPTRSSRLCKMHFEPSCFTINPEFLQKIGCKSKFNLRLKPDAIPTIFSYKPSRNGTPVRFAGRKRLRTQAVEDSILAYDLSNSAEMVETSVLAPQLAVNSSTTSSGSVVANHTGKLVQLPTCDVANTSTVDIKKEPESSSSATPPKVTQSPQLQSTSTPARLLQNIASVPLPTPQITQQTVKRALSNPFAKAGKSSALSVTPDRNVKQQSLTGSNKEYNEKYNRFIISQLLRNLLKRVVSMENRKRHLIEIAKHKQKLKKQEEERQTIVAYKQIQLLFKQKQLLKRDMLKKRALLEKKLQFQINQEILLYGLPENENIAAGKLDQRRKADVDNLTTIARAPKQKKQGVPARKIVCICKKVYNPSRFMIGCDRCENLFHPECVDLGETQIQSNVKFMCPQCVLETSEELYCLCKQPYDKSQFFICCNQCRDWFHGCCVGILQSEADTIEEYICPTCQDNSEINRANLKPLTAEDYDQLRNLLHSLRSHKCSWPFSHPVDAREAPDYYRVIKEPMDLQIMEKKLNNKKYNILSEFIGDVAKIFDNCRYYNPRDSAFYRCAEVLESFFVREIKIFRSRIS